MMKLIIVGIIFLVGRTWQVFSVWQVYMLMHADFQIKLYKPTSYQMFSAKKCVFHWHALLSCYLHDWLASLQM
jgi:hypothetical protein